MIQLTRRQLLGRSLATCALPLAGSITWAQAPYPSRPVKWLVPYLAGTAPDNSARILAEAVSPILGQPIVIENRPGAAGNIGTRLAAKAPADGYTWLYAGTPIASNMRTYKSPGYDALKDFRHVVRLTASDVGLIVNAESDIKTLDDLLARLKARPGQVDYASGGNGTPSHLGMELLMSVTGTQAMHVPYKGASELVNAVLGKQVVFGMPILSVAVPFIQSGKLRALAISGHERNPAVPQVPTFAELGVKGVELTSWGGVSVPAGTPDAVVERIHAAFAQALKSPELIARLEQQGGRVRVLASDEFVRSIEQEMKATETMMKKVGLEPV